MPKIDLTLNRWGLVLKAIRTYMHEKHISFEEAHGLRAAEDSIINMAFQLAKSAEVEKSMEQAAWEIIAERHARDMQEERPSQAHKPEDL